MQARGQLRVPLGVLDPLMLPRSGVPKNTGCQALVGWPSHLSEIIAAIHQRRLNNLRDQKTHRPMFITTLMARKAPVLRQRAEDSGPRHLAVCAPRSTRMMLLDRVAGRGQGPRPGVHGALSAGLEAGLPVCVNSWPLVSSPVASLNCFPGLVRWLFAFPQSCLGLASPGCL